MKLSLREAVRQTNGTLEIAYISELPNTAIKHDRDGQYFIEVNGEIGKERFDSPEAALQELENRE
jgi:hypothetical protein